MMGLSNYPPGVTGNEDYLTGRISSGRAKVKVTITHTVEVEADTDEEAGEKAILMVEEMIKVNETKDIDYDIAFVG